MAGLALDPGLSRTKARVPPKGLPKAFSAEVTANTGKDAGRAWDGGRERRGRRQEGQCQEPDSVQTFPHVGFA